MVYLLALIGMICWGISPILAKLGLKDINPLIGLSVRTFFTAIVILFWLLFTGNITDLKLISSKALLLLIVEAILAILIGDLAYFAALKRGSASVVMFIMACSPLVTLLCSMVFLNEKMTITSLIGAGLTMVGLILLI